MELYVRIIVPCSSIGLEECSIRSIIEGTSRPYVCNSQIYSITSISTISTFNCIKGNFEGSFSQVYHKVLILTENDQVVFCKNDFLKMFQKFTGKHLHQSSINKEAAFEPEILSKNRLWYRCFPVNFAKFAKHLLCRTSPNFLE